MIRFLIICINDCRDFPDFSLKRLVERITDFLTTLIECYQEVHETLGNNQSNNKCYISLNECEFHAYNLIFQIPKPYNLYKCLGNLGSEENRKIIMSKEVFYFYFS